MCKFDFTYFNIMPEGPEVKIISDNITHFLLDKTLLELTVVKDSFEKRTKNFDKLVLPQKVVTVGVKGKFCYIRLADKSAIAIGFGMTGNIRIEPDDEYLAKRKETREKYMKHCSVKFSWAGEEDSGVFYYNSIRNFGFIHYLTEQELGKKLALLGPSILDVAGPLSQKVLVQRWRRGDGRNICDVLVSNQNLISGIGNYIKAEILYSVGVHPLAIVKALDDDTLYQLYIAAVQIAQNAYAAGGASLYTYTGLHGDKSEFKTELQVYNRTKDPDGNKVEQLKTPDKRTTYWVPSKQQLGNPVPKERIRIRVTKKT